MKVMRGALVGILLILTAGMASAKEVTMVTNTYFQNGVVTGVAFNAPGALDIYMSTESRIEVTMNSAYMKNFQITLEKGELVVTFKGSKSVSDLNLKVVAYITSPLAKIEANKGGKIELHSSFSAQNLKVDLDGASTLRGLTFNGTSATIALDGQSQLTESTLETTMLSLELAGASKAIFKGTGSKEIKAKIDGASSLELTPGVTGTTQKLTLSTTGASMARLDNILATNGKLLLNGASSCWVWIADKANIEAEGASKIYTKGATNEVITSIAGGSEIIKQ